MKRKIIRRAALIYILMGLLTGGQCVWLSERLSFECIRAATLWPLIAYEVFIVQEGCGGDPEDLSPCSSS